MGGCATVGRWDPKGQLPDLRIGGTIRYCVGWDQESSHQNGEGGKGMAVSPPLVTSYDSWNTMLWAVGRGVARNLSRFVRKTRADPICIRLTKLMYI